MAFFGHPTHVSFAHSTLDCWWCTPEPDVCELCLPCPFCTDFEAGNKTNQVVLDEEQEIQIENFENDSDFVFELSPELAARFAVTELKRRKRAEEKQSKVESKRGKLNSGQFYQRKGISMQQEDHVDNDTNKGIDIDQSRFLASISEDEKIKWLEMRLNQEVSKQSNSLPIWPTVPLK